jgi:hypothetical protein
LRRAARPGQLSPETKLIAFEDFVCFIREFRKFSSGREITRRTEFERDLGITGDDGIDLLLAAQKRFNVSLTPELLSLKPGEVLFHSEGFGPNLLGIFRREPASSVRRFTIGDLYDALSRAC